MADLLAACKLAWTNLMRWTENSAWDQQDDKTLDVLEAAIKEAEAGG